MVACRTLSKAKQFVGDTKNATAQSLDVSNPQALDDAVSQHHLIISLIPYTHHVAVIQSAIKHKRNVVTTSYVSKEIKALEPESSLFHTNWAKKVESKKPALW